VKHTHGINTIHAFTRHPQGNASNERSHRTIIEALRIYGNGYKERWATFVPAVQYAYNTTPHNRDATGITPYHLMFGLPPPAPHGHMKPPRHLNAQERELWAWSFFDQTLHFREVWSNIRAHQRQLRNDAKELRKPPAELQPGQLCLMLPSQGNPVSKLDFAALGPFRVLQRVTGGYKLQNDVSRRTFFASEKDVRLFRHDPNRLASLGGERRGLRVTSLHSGRTNTKRVRDSVKAKQKAGPPKGKSRGQHDDLTIAQSRPRRNRHPRTFLKLRMHGKTHEDEERTNPEVENDSGKEDGLEYEPMDTTEDHDPRIVEQMVMS